MPITRPPGRGSVRMAFERAVHPATKLPLLGSQAEDATCGGCAHLYRRASARGQTLNCARKASRTRPGANIQPVFPACTAYEPGTPAIG
ncbi:hypothetical protein ACFRMQ_00075 [Kitasatospora sp. NPDC056783]|uniref:hypothetical protein n=1 Tax=Kitasatospora sp. NPDC056783 TaxID=3345943 RepID=UPI0036918DC3